ncbi:MAG: HD domain-containing protein [Candidatus Lokiarchaeota archaeon]|nr:HD domain-containing protein [Candidatus Lokiarchaeota archaeon]
MNYININDPISGFIFIPKDLVTLIDSNEIQRLRRIKQLSGAEYVYPGANHTRFEHSIGVMSNVQNLLDLLEKNENLKIDSQYRKSAVVAGLTHDLGHGPFSHNFEDILVKKSGKDHEDFTRMIILNSGIGDKIEKLGLDKHIVADLAVGRYNKDDYLYLDQMIAGAIDCDQMDYLVRDSYHCGTNISPVIRKRIMTLAGITPSMDLGYNIKGIATLESFLLARLNAFRTIYFHKTSRAVQLMLGKAIKEYNKEMNAFDFTNAEEYLRWDDISLYNELLHCNKSKEIMKKIRRRDLIKCAYEKPNKISKGEEKPKMGNPKKIRQDIADKSNLYIEDIYIDFPMMTSVPYQHSTSLKQTLIPVFTIDNHGNKIMEEIEKKSLFFDQIKGYYNLVRVYCDKKYRDIVKKTAKQVLFGLTLDEFW